MVDVITVGDEISAKRDKVIKSLKEMNKRVKQNRPNFMEDPYHIIISDEGKVLQVTAFGTGCRFDGNGSCLMCDYGKREKMPTPAETYEWIVRAFGVYDAQEKRRALDKGRKFPPVVVLDCNGSILDEHDFPRENLIATLEALKKIDPQGTEIVFETHYHTLNREVLELIDKYLPNNPINFELGFETANEEVRDLCLLKHIPNKVFVEKTKLVNEFKRSSAEAEPMSVSANVLVGIPFLTSQEQLKDAVDSIKFCIDNGVRNCVVFPMNDKDCTLLHYCYEKGLAKQPPIYLLTEVLKKLPDKYLNKSSLAWTGNRVWTYSDSSDRLAKFIKDTKKPDGADALTKDFSDFNTVVAWENPTRKREIVNNIHEKLKNNEYYIGYQEELASSSTESRTLIDRVENVNDVMKKAVYAPNFIKLDPNIQVPVQ